jgi:hypothetical protein
VAAAVLRYVKQRKPIADDVSSIGRAINRALNLE